MAFVSRQTNGADALCEWCLRREQVYWTRLGWSHEQSCYAAARDVACYQLKALEADVWATLQAFETSAAHLKGKANA